MTCSHVARSAISKPNPVNGDVSSWLAVGGTHVTAIGFTVTASAQACQGICCGSMLDGSIASSSPRLQLQE